MCRSLNKSIDMLFDMAHTLVLGCWPVCSIMLATRGKEPGSENLCAAEGLAHPVGVDLADCASDHSPNFNTPSTCHDLSGGLCSSECMTKSKNNDRMLSLQCLIPGPTPSINLPHNDVAACNADARPHRTDRQGVLRRCPLSHVRSRRTNGKWHDQVAQNFRTTHPTTKITPRPRNMPPSQRGLIYPNSAIHAPEKDRDSTQIS